jgi:hypothetical protein
MARQGAEKTMFGTTARDRALLADHVSMRNRTPRERAQSITNIIHNNNQQTDNSRTTVTNNSEIPDFQPIDPRQGLPEQPRHYDMGTDSRRAMSGFTLNAMAMTAGLTTITRYLYQFSESVSAGQRHLENYNSTIAYSYAQLELARIHREIGRGKATGESNKWMNEQINEMERSLLPYQTVAQDMKNYGAGYAAQAVQVVAGHAETVATWIPIIGAKIDEMLEDARQKLKDGEGFEGSALKALFDERDKRVRDEKRRAGPPVNNGGIF